MMYADKNKKWGKSMGMKDERGFTLVELAVVLIIIGILSGAFFSFMHVLSMSRKSELLDSKLDIIRRAISEYIEDDPLDPTDITEMRYPCPASPTAAIGSAEYGVENRVGGVCSATNGVAQAIGTAGQVVFIGAVPTRTLSIAGDYMYDPYHNRFTYAVSGNLTQVNALSGVNSGAITIVDESATITDRAHFALVSHGEIGTGGYSDGGALLGNCDTDNDGDSENCDGDATFIAEQGMTLANTAAFNDDSVLFDLVDDTDDEWWQATDISGQNINNRNPGNVGIGTVTPASRLDVAGAVRIGSVPDADCTVGAVGAMRYNTATDAIEYCAADNGSGAPGWKPSGGGLRPIGGGMLGVGETNLGSNWSTVFFEGTYASPDSGSAGGVVWEQADGTKWLALTSATGGGVFAALTNAYQCSFPGNALAEFCAKLVGGDLWIKAGTFVDVSYVIFVE
ncbi:MAG: type II secretion system protein [Rhodospirillales bacterium]|nr:type II secretion system protein [Rhodospirillales bacterium]